MTEFERECRLLEQNGLKDSPLRQEYEEKVAALSSLPEQLRSAGYTETQIARRMHEARRELGRVYKEAAPPLFRAYIYAATKAKYGDPLGPTFEQLNETKSDAEIIASASRPIRNLDDRLTIPGFRAWYHAHYPAEAADSQEDTPCSNS